MGVNVLLFLVFQILVEPWRRQRLVKGFEDKVKEAIETEAATNRAIVAGLARTAETEADTVIETSTAAESLVSERTPEDIADNSSWTESGTVIVSSSVDGAPTSEERSEEVKTLLSQPSILLSTEYWKRTIQDTFSDRHVVLTQRELTTIIIQSAAIPATIIGVTIAILRLL